MKNIKKLLSLVLVCALLGTLAPLSVSAQSNSMYREVGIIFKEDYQPTVPGTLEVSDNFWARQEEQWVLREEAETRTVENTGVSLWCDVNSDSSVNVDDATELQKAVAQMISIPEEKLAETAEINMDGIISVSDVTTLQRMLADFDLKQVTAGDVDRNGKLDENDIISFFKYFNYEEIKNDLSDATNIEAKNYIIANYTEEMDLDLAHADFDGNGEVGVDDVYALINQFDIYYNALLDVTQDGFHDGRDLNCIKEYLVGTMGIGSPMRTPKSVLLADVNEDGIVNIEDVHFFQKMFAGVGGFESPNTSWISKEMIEKDRELQTDPDLIRRIFSKINFTDRFYIAPNGLVNRPYFYENVSGWCADAVDRYGVIYSQQPVSYLLGYDINKNNSKQKNIYVPANIFGFEFGDPVAYVKGKDYSQISLEKSYTNGTPNNVFVFCKNIYSVKGPFFKTCKNLFVPNAGCFDAVDKVETLGAVEYVSSFYSSTFEHVVLPRGYTYIRSFEESKGLKSFTDVFAPDVVNIAERCFNDSSFEKIVVPARIKNIQKNAFAGLKIPKTLNAFCDNNQKSYNIVFLSKSMPYDKDYFQKLDGTDFTHYVSLWPQRRGSDKYWTIANANVNVFAFESSGVAQDLYWFYSESDCAIVHHKNQSETKDFIYKPVYL